MRGLGVAKFAFGGISAWLSTSAVLIRPAMPAAGSRCPIRPFTAPILTGGRLPLLPEHFTDRFRLDRIAERRAGAVRLDIGDLFRPDAG